MIKPEQNRLLPFLFLMTKKADTITLFLWLKLKWGTKKVISKEINDIIFVWQWVLPSVWTQGRDEVT